MPRSDFLKCAVAAARLAGKRLKLDFASIGSLTVRHKAGLDDPFTEADTRAETTIRAHIRAAFPDHAFLGEESGLEEGRDAHHVWIVDPLDGTMNFLTGLPLWAVNIGLARDGHVIAGVTYVPMLDELFEAEEGAGAFLNGVPIRVSSRATMLESVLAVGIPFASKSAHAGFVREMERLTPRVSGIRRLGAGAIDMAYVACGRFDAYWEQQVSPWDMAAGVVIVREAGGRVTGTDGAPLDLMGGHMLACQPNIQPELLTALRPD